MTDASPLRLTRHERVLEICIDRPKANAIDAATSRALSAAFERLRDDDDLQVGVITGAGPRIFCAGWDMKAAIAEGEMEGADFGPGGFAGLNTLLDLNKPLIAAVNGAAIGGGVELCLASDIVVAANHATFSLPETGLGVMADAGGVQRLARRLPRNVANEMLFTGRAMSAEEACRWGFVNHVTDAEGLMPAARALAQRIADGAPLALQAIKEVGRYVEVLPDRDAFRAPKESTVLVTYQRMLHSEDHDEGVRAFTEKRKPVWKGR